MLMFLIVCAAAGVAILPRAAVLLYSSCATVPRMVIRVIYNHTPCARMSTPNASIEGAMHVKSMTHVNVAQQ